MKPIMLCCILPVMLYSTRSKPQRQQIQHLARILLILRFAEDARHRNGLCKTVICVELQRPEHRRIGARLRLEIVILAELAASATALRCAAVECCKKNAIGDCICMNSL